jgi:16S rRNA (guanine527-N7)-methyltransferase
MDFLLKYFPGLNERQQAQFEQLGALYREWNERINVISRKDIDHLYEHHILHSLALAKVVQFKPGARILDLGTGGGLPGIPLAILFPETHFTLIDGTRKKITVVQEIVQALELPNVVALHQRVEETKGQFDFVMSRGVAPLDQLYNWSRRLFAVKHQHVLPNGLLVLKGGDLRAEVKALPKGIYLEQIPITSFFQETYYEEKFVVYVQA